MLHMKDTIRDRRRALGLTQQQMAERLGVSAAAVSKWEMGASYPDVMLLLAKDEREQAKVLLKNTLFRRAGDMQQLLLRLEQMELDEGNLAHAQSLADLTQSFVSLLCMHPYVGHLAQLMPALKRQDEAESLKHIRAMLDALESPWSPGECLPYAHSGVKKGGHVTMSAGIIREMQESEEYAFLRGNKAFIALLADYTPGGCHPSSHSASQTP